MNASYFRSEISSLPAYVPGARSADLAVIKVASNEMPFPPLPGVQAVIASHIADISRYPDMAATQLLPQIAAYHKLGKDNIALGNGSTDLVENFLAAVCTPGSEVIYPWRSFEAYPIAVQIAGATSVKIPLRADGNNDLAAMLQAITERTRAIIVCTPNNPTGSALTHTELRDFLIQVPRTIPVLLDEAYVDFVRMDDAVRSVELLAEFPNVLSLRTFSKAYGLAGLRIGYALGQPEIVAGLRAIATPFGVNVLAQAAARSALLERKEVDRRVNIIVDEREKLSVALRAVGWKGPISQSNFMWFDTRDATAEFVELCATEGITVRGFAGEGTRVTIAEAEASLRLLRAVNRFRASLES